MSADDPRRVLRLPKKHAPAASSRASAADGARLLDAQSLRSAAFAALIVIILFSVLWAMLSTAINRVFPWMTVILGMLLGFAVRRAGRGVDWRFPTLAALAALAGALVANVVVAAAFTAVELGTGTLRVLMRVTTMTWPVYFDEALTSADVIYALIAALLAAFYANRRLTRAEYTALRRWQEEHERRT